MILRVILATRSCVKVLGSVMDAAIARRHTLDIRVRSRPYRDEVEARDYTRWPHVTTAIADATIAVRLEEARHGVGLKVIVPYFWEFLMQHMRAYVGSDILVCYPSEEAAQRHGAPAAVVTGWTIADHARLVPTDASLRRRHIFFSMKRDVPRQQRVPYLQLALLDRWSARRRGLEWVVKTRAKHKDPWWLRRLAYWYYEDRDMYPHTSQRLLATAASMSHFTSGAVAEAVLHNVPTLWYRSADHRHLLRPHEKQPDDYLQPWLMDKPTYVRRFLGWDDGHNGDRVISAIEARLHAS